MKKYLSLFVLLLLSLNLGAWERTKVWPDGKMPHPQDGQVAAMSNEMRAPGFKPDEFRGAYLEWYEAPDPAVRKGVCMILISGGAYNGCVDTRLIDLWHETFTKLGVQ